MLYIIQYANILIHIESIKVNILNVQVWVVNITKHAIVCSILTRPSAPFHIMYCGASGKEPTCQCRRWKRCRLDPWVGKIPWRRARQPTPVLLPGESHGQKSLVGCSPWGCRKANTTEATELTCKRSTIILFWILKIPKLDSAMSKREHPSSLTPPQNSRYKIHREERSAR